jgi:hypothetical protein
MIRENLIVYEALKNTTLHCEDGIRNARIYMYSVYFLVITFGVEYNWLFWVSFFVLIAFQTMMNIDRIAVERISSYIRVFFESKRDDMHWSLLNKDIQHLEAYQMIYKNIGWYIHTAGASILAGISFVAIIFISLDKYDIYNQPSAILLVVLMDVILFGAVLYVNSKVYINPKKDEAALSVLDSSVEKFYAKIDQTSHKEKVIIRVRKNDKKSKGKKFDSRKSPCLLSVKR